ncbi:hypothetical protein [Mycobacterium phage Fezzik]|nr:hypothetical protein [Mycobacterium phage Fezzik]
MMEGKPVHWTEEAACQGDTRYTGRMESLTFDDLSEMTVTCARCPVVRECADWAKREQVIEVFAAGYWRLPRDNSA